MAITILMKSCSKENELALPTNILDVARLLIDIVERRAPRTVAPRPPREDN